MSCPRVTTAHTRKTPTSTKADTSNDRQRERERKKNERRKDRISGRHGFRSFDATIVDGFRWNRISGELILSLRGGRMCECARAFLILLAKWECFLSLTATNLLFSFTSSSRGGGGWVDMKRKLRRYNLLR